MRAKRAARIAYLGLGTVIVTSIRHLGLHTHHPTLLSRLSYPFLPWRQSPGHSRRQQVMARLLQNTVPFRPNIIIATRDLRCSDEIWPIFQQSSRHSSPPSLGYLANPVNAKKPSCYSTVLGHSLPPTENGIYISKYRFKMKVGILTKPMWLINYDIKSQKHC